MKDNKIERLIDDIIEYIDSCKFKTFSNTEIIVDKDQIDSMLSELKNKTPKEFEKCQQIIAGREDILNDARNKAQALIDKATEKTTALVSEHEIMLEAYRRADEVVDMATAQAQEILDNAIMEANGYRDSAMAYTDEILAQVEGLIGHYMEKSNATYNSLYDQLGECMDIIKANREELAPPEAPLDEQVKQLLSDEENVQEDADDILSKIDMI